MIWITMVDDSWTWMPKCCTSHPEEIVHETIIEIFKIFSPCQISSMAAARFRPPKTEEEEISLLSETVPKNTKYNTKWAVNVFTAWQNTRMNKKAQLETSGGNVLESTNVEELSVPLEHMSAESLNFWLCKFICESKLRSKPGTLPS